MSRLIVPQEDFELNIVFEGKNKKIKVKPDKYYLLDREKENSTKIPVLKHDALINIADEYKFKVEKTVLEFGAFNNPKNFCFIHRSYGQLANGSMVDEVGEANPSNLDTNIGIAYPAIMSNKRAQDRLLIRLMGLIGEVYSDVEFSNEAGNNNSSSKSADTGKTGTLTIEEANKLIVDYGKYKKNPITLEQMKETEEENFKWLLNGYKPNSKSSEKMKLLHEGAVILSKVVKQG